MRSTSLFALITLTAISWAGLNACKREEPKAPPPPPPAPAPVVAPTAPPTPTTPSETAPSETTTTENPSALLQQVQNYIAENKLDLAEQGLSKLEAMKDSLPESLQSQVASARATLNAAKTTNAIPRSIKLPR